MRRLALLLALLALPLASCGETTTLAPSGPVLSRIPWSAPETARYRLLEGDDVRGNGVLRIEQTGDVLLFTQTFEFSDRDIRDVVSVRADGQSLRPQSVERRVDGPKGERVWQALYEGNLVTVDQRSGEDERTDRLNVPTKSYDSWSDLFLWRTLAFAQEFEASYQDVISCDFVKPQVISVVLKVHSRETIEVPAGTFDAWRLEVRSGGRSQKAWYADNEERTLVRYDNGELVFELESRG